MWLMLIKDLLLCFRLCGLLPLVEGERCSLVQWKILRLPLDHLPDAESLSDARVANQPALGDGERVGRQPVQVQRLGAKNIPIVNQTSRPPSETRSTHRGKHAHDRQADDGHGQEELLEEGRHGVEVGAVRAELDVQKERGGGDDGEEEERVRRRQVHKPQQALDGAAEASRWVEVVFPVAFDSTGWGESL